MKKLRNSAIKWLLVSLTCLLVGLFVGKFKQDMLTERLTLLNKELVMVQMNYDELETAVYGLQTSSVIDQQTINNLLETNKTLQNELASANNKLFFYERVVAPELDVTGIKIHSFEIVKDLQTQRWQYELVLMQSQKDRRLIKGKVDIVLSVLQEGGAKEVSFSHYAEEVKNNFEFKYFQTMKGEFSLPIEVEVDEIIVKLNVPGSRWHKAQKVEERYDWNVLTHQGIDEPMLENLIQ